MNTSWVGIAVVVVAFSLAGCANKAESSPDSGAGGADGGLTWFTTCGDPVCRGEDAHREMPDVAPCTTQMAGQRCAIKDQLCDPKGSCNEALQCSDHDPKMRPGGCPISSRRFKADIAYLTERDRQQIAAELSRLRLARYRYNDDPTAHPRLGFILEDAPGSPAADLERDRVDLYTYLSMIVATVQTQGQQLEAQRNEIQSLRRQLAKRRRPKSAAP